MDKAITTAFFVVIGAVLSVLLFNAVVPAVVQSSDAMRNLTGRTSDRLKSEVEVIHAAGELDSSGFWDDVNGNGDFELFFWVKNVGSLRIVPIESSDVFFGVEGDFVRIPHESEAGGSYPYWTAVVENGSQWSPTATVKITINYGLTTLSSDQYFIKINTPSGVNDDYLFSM